MNHKEGVQNTISKVFCGVKGVRHWHRLPREVVDAPSLAGPGRVRLRATQSSGRSPCPRQGVWNKMFFQVPVNPNNSRILGSWEKGTGSNCLIAGQQCTSSQAVLILFATASRDF